MGMKKEEYLKELTKQLHYAPVRKVVSQEYIDHIEDETEYQKTFAAIEQKTIVLKKFVKENFEH